jgi:hypothetical protein
MRERREIVWGSLRIRSRSMDAVVSKKEVELQIKYAAAGRQNAGPSAASLAMKLRETSLRMTLLGWERKEAKAKTKALWPGGLLVEKRVSPLRSSRGRELFRSK